MKLLELSLQAFGPYLASQSIDFTQAHDHGLFLVQGPTGSGKSSLLDALCFCLYGIPSGDKRDLSELRCHLAPEDLRTATDLQFMIGGKTYRASRSFIIKKGAVDDHQCLMEVLEADGSWRALYTRLAQAQEVVASILGLKAEQFRQVILLPQGKFRDFLVASSKDRTEILKTLFNTQDLDRFMGLLQDRLGYIRLETKEKQARIQAVYQSLGLDSSSGLQDLASKTSRELEAAEALLKDLKEKVALARLSVDKAREEQSLKEELKTAIIHIDELETLRPDQEAARLSLARARKVAPLTERGREIKNRREEQKNLETRLAGARDSASQARNRLDTLESEAPEIASLGSRIQSLKSSLQALASLTSLGGIAREKKSNLDRSSKSLTDTTLKQETAKSRLSSLEKDLANYHLTWDDSARSGPGDTLTGIETLKSLQRDLESLAVQDRENSLARDADLQRLAAVLHQLAGTQDSLREVETRMDQAVHEKSRLDSSLLQSRANALRTSLESGKPCPVCGSLDHPALTRDTQESGQAGTSDAEARDLETWTARIDALSQEIQDLRIRQAQSETQIQEIQDRLQAQDPRHQETEKNLSEKTTVLMPLLEEFCTIFGKTFPPALWGQSPGAPIGLTPARLVKLKEFILDLEMHQTKLGEEKRKIVSGIEILRQEIQSLEVRENELSLELDRSRGESLELEKQITTLCDTSGVNTLLAGLESPLDIRVDLLALEVKRRENTLTEMESRQRTHEQDIALARQSSSHHASTAAGLEANLEDHRTLTDGLEKAWLADLASAGFTGVEDARSAVRKEAEMEKLEAGLKSWDEEVRNLGQRRSMLESRFQNSTALDLGTVTTEWETLNSQLEATLQNQGLQAARLAQIRIALAEEARLGLEFQASEDKLALHDGLFRLLNGQDNRLRINLERYALSVYLDEVLEEANIHLDRMSRGRYALQRQDEGQDRRKTAGLEIGIMDAYTARFRSCASLSGGESFMAALALALGLSATVHRRSGGVRLDTLLIDEGFGSLDEEALQDAMAVLSLLKEKGQLVGIISHVRELQERIACQLLVKRGPRGSSLSWAH